MVWMAQKSEETRMVKISQQTALDYGDGTVHSRGRMGRMPWQTAEYGGDGIYKSRSWWG